jgi:mono/diheme cytochrome c family protein
MKPRKNKPVAPDVDEREPKADFSLIPLWLVIAFVMLIYWGQLYLDQHGGGFNALVHEPYYNLAAVGEAHPMTEGGELLAKGRLLFRPNCAVCHQDTGRGVPGQFPPLAGADWVEAEGSERLIRIVLHGLHGPIMVNDTQYNAAMFGFKDMLGDEEIAAILSYIRNSWGNKGSMVAPEEVAQIRSEEAGRTTPWTADELLQVPLGAPEQQ